MNSMMMTRRQALTWAGTGALALAGRTALPVVPRRRVPIAVQLWSVRKDCAKDFNATLKRVAELGFEGVEFANNYHQYKDDAKGLKKVLADLGLGIAGTHTRTASLTGDNLKRTIDFHTELGCKFLIVAGDGAFYHPEKSKPYAETLTKAAEALKPAGLYCGYHNHTREFQKQDGKTYWDLFAQRTSKDVVLQQDVGWTAVAGLDPVAYVRKYPGRTKTTHFKAKFPKGTQGKKNFIGEDIIDWKGLITACEEVGGTEWFIVEQEDYPDGLSPMDCTERSLKGLKKILKGMGKK